MGAYRAGHGTGPAEEGREDGLVGELIQQFADPLAFYRELVQNSIDAGATAIGVTLTFQPDPGADGDALGTVDVAVRDDGCGMSREILEEQLTVLFRSGKEGRDDTIGKFGVGFVSVLAIAPEVVIVRTTEGRGDQWTLELKTDQSYELFHARAAGGAGTTVTLRLRRRASEVEGLVKGSAAALAKWCRHAEIPIRFVASVSGGEVIHESRIDRPLGVDALVSVTVVDGATTVVAGLPRDGSPHVAFFNRGLLLHETGHDLLGRVAVSIQDPRLEHTLSRDNVRRDAHYERAMRIARRVVDRDLTIHVHDVLAKLARREADHPPLEELLAVAWNAGLDLDRRAIRVPLLEPVQGERAIPVAALGKKDVYVAEASDALTQVVARAGGHVIDLSVARNRTGYASTLSVLAGRAIPEVHQALTLAAEVDATGSDLALVDRVRELLAAILRRPNGPLLARFSGARANKLTLTGTSAGLPVALDEDDALADPFRLVARPPLLLNADYDAVRAARQLAPHDLETAAALLVRVLLLWRGDLDEDAEDERWLAAAAEAIE